MGMTINDLITGLQSIKAFLDYSEFKGLEEQTKIQCSVIDGAIETMRKYQQLQADYENRLKADMVAMLTEIQLEIEEKEQHYQDKFLESRNAVHDAAMGGRMFGCGECKEIIQQKINALKENNE